VEPIAEKWAAFGWHVQDLDGHDVGALEEAFEATAGEERPSVIIARTDILGRLRSIPATADGHFLTLDDDLVQAIRAELAQTVQASG
jgi:transketolase